MTSTILDFNLEDLQITAGTTVTWVNLDAARHTSTVPTTPGVAKDPFSRCASAHGDISSHEIGYVDAGTTSN